MKQLILSFFCLMNFVAFSQVQSNYNESLETLVKEFTRCINEKDSAAFKKLFFTESVPFVGIMSEATEASIKKNYAEFEGISVSNSKQFMEQIINSKKVQSERIYHLKYETDNSIASIDFDYSFTAGEKMIQWGHESWNLVYVDNTWLITDVIFSIHFPKVEACDFCN